ncbi:hypothetical protein RUM44_008870 [Polyplax serrata]|uniref:Ig-like domain-containing protein n=1 Tax=Polyplax serrata TaxID=468196 RepID=A0ABR1BDF7_POLSC
MMDDATIFNYAIYACGERMILVTGQGREFRSPRIIEHPTDATVGRQVPVMLNCKAEGYPEPAIEWFKDGDLVKSTKSNGALLTMGSLFFFKGLHRRKDSTDEGVYWCTARNSAGVARSRNATLHLAGLFFLLWGFTFPYCRKMEIADLFRGFYQETLSLENLRIIYKLIQLQFIPRNSIYNVESKIA